jgi:hypothetical protein
MFAPTLVQFIPSLDRSKLKFPKTPSFGQKYVVASKFAIPFSCHTAHSALVLVRVSRDPSFSKLLAHALSNPRFALRLCSLLKSFRSSVIVALVPLDVKVTSWVVPAARVRH